MESNNFFDFVQQGFRTAVGAAASAMETLQNPQKRQQTLSELNEEWQKKSQEWEKKGEITEQEARRTIEQFFSKTQKSGEGNSSEFTEDSSANVSGVSSTKPSNAKEIQELSEAIISLREELEKANQ